MLASRRFDLGTFGVHPTIFEDGLFRIDVLEETSTTWAELSIDDSPSAAQTKTTWQGVKGQ